jgi:hypothetical protein
LGLYERSFWFIFNDIQKVIPLDATDVMFAGFVVSGQSWTLITSSVGLDWIVDAESLWVALFPLFLGGMPVPVKIFPDRVSPNSSPVLRRFFELGWVCEFFRAFPLTVWVFCWLLCSEKGSLLVFGVSWLSSLNDVGG